MPQLLDRILGYVSDHRVSHALHDLSHQGRVEYLTISPDDVSRRRFRLQTDQGTDCAIMLGRDQQLCDGAVLMLGDDGAIVVRLSEREWLAIMARDTASALELGYFVGNLHWKVRFKDEIILVALEGPRHTYLDRIEGLLADGKAIVAEEGHG